MPIEYNTTRELWKTALIVPVLRENPDLPQVVTAMSQDVYAMVVVSMADDDAAAADAAYCAGATVVVDRESGGYGAACERALRVLPETIDSVIFQGADPVDADALLEPIRSGAADLVGYPVTGSLRASRAIRADALRRLGPLRERGWEWNIEMQVRAVQQGLRVVEVPCGLPSGGVMEWGRVQLAMIRLWWWGLRRSEEARS